MFIQMLRVFPLCGLSFALIGCEAPLPSVPSPEVGSSPGDPWTEWRSIADAAPMERDMERAVALSSALATSEVGLTPLVEYVGDSAVPADKKIVAIICLTTQRDRLAPFEERLRGWTGPDQPEETRKMATHVLGMLSTPGAMERLKSLLEDSQRPIRETAVGVLLSFHPELVQERLQPFWDDPETSVSIREQVVLGMPPHLVAPFIGIYGEAVLDTRLSATARLKSVSVLGQLGAREHVEILRKCVDNDPDEVVKERARGALALLEAAAGLDPVPAGQGEAETLPPTATPSGPPA